MGKTYVPDLKVPNRNFTSNRSATNPKVMLDFVESARAVLSEKDYDTIANKVLAVIRQHENRRITEYETKRVFALSRGMENWELIFYK